MQVATKTSHLSGSFWFTKSVTNITGFCFQIKNAKFAHKIISSPTPKIILPNLQRKKKHQVSPFLILKTTCWWCSTTTHCLWRHAISEIWSPRCFSVGLLHLSVTIHSWTLNVSDTDVTRLNTTKHFPMMQRQRRNARRTQAGGRVWAGGSGVDRTTIFFLFFKSGIKKVNFSVEERMDWGTDGWFDGCMAVDVLGGRVCR